MGMIGNTPFLGQVGTGSIQDGGVETVDIKDGAVTAAKLASNAFLINLGYTPTNKAGDTLTGPLLLKANQYVTDGASTLNNKGLDAQNSDLVGLNGLWFQDLADSASEGIHYARTNGNWDTLRAIDGVLYFAPNRSTNSTGTAVQVLTSAGGSINGSLEISAAYPSIKFDSTAQDVSFDCAIGGDGEDFVIFEPEDATGTQVSQGGREWFRIKDDEYAYIFGRRVWEAGNAPSAVLQTKQSTNNSSITVTNSNYYWLTTSLPKMYSSSKVLLMVCFAWNGDNPNGNWQLQRSYDNSSWSTISYIASRDETSMTAGDVEVISHQYLDSPSSSYGTVYYRAAWIHNIQNGGTMCINRPYNNDLQGAGNYTSTLTLMEISA